MVGMEVILHHSIPTTPPPAPLLSGSALEEGKSASGKLTRMTEGKKTIVTLMLILGYRKKDLICLFVIYTYNKRAGWSSGSSSGS